MKRKDIRKDRSKRAAHFRALQFRTDRTVRRCRALTALDMRRIEASGLDAMPRPLQGQPVQHQAER